MKKYLIFVVLTFVITNTSFAQKALTRFGFRAGPNVTFAKYRFPENDTIAGSPIPAGAVLNREVKHGYSFGMGFIIERDVPKISKNAFLTSGLTFKGAQHSIRTLTLEFYEGSHTDHTQNFHVFALQVPIFFNYKVRKLSVGAGVYGEWQFAGYEKFQIKNLTYFMDDIGKERLTFGNDEKKINNTFRHFTAGLRGEIGYVKNRWRVTAQIDLGLTNTLSSFYTIPIIRELQNPLSSTLRHRTLGLSFIYMPWPH